MKNNDIGSISKARMFVLLVASMLIACRDNSPLVYTTIQDAVLAGDLADVKRHINRGADINDTQYLGLAPLIIATLSNKTEIAEYLLFSGADINILDNSLHTPLFYAVSNGNKYLARLLLVCSAKSNISDRFDQTPLHVAAREGYLEIARLLIAHNADLNARDLFQMSPCQWAVHKKHMDVVELLRKKGAKDCGELPSRF